MRKYKIRPATKKDFTDFYGKQLPCSSRAWSIEYEGKLASISGIAFMPSYALAFSDIMEGVDAPDIVIWRASIEVFEKMKNVGVPMIAFITGEFPRAPKFLERLGFVYIGDVSGMGGYKWETQ